MKLSPFSHVMDSYMASTRYGGHSARYQDHRKWTHGTGKPTISEHACAGLCERVITHNRMPDDRGSCTEEPCEIKRPAHSSESEIGIERFLPAVTIR
jgi:hypothetical protein